ncbi:MAG: hypothetical protein E8D44_13020 [Nitrospira sp.]|nr:MAG: hypothetical protein E8D44_13020 [Nitrospira sp.]
MSATLYSSRSRGWWLIVCCLCLCVMVQMLGVPATLLSPADSSDLLGSSVLEGFSVISPSPELVLPAISIALSNVSPLALAFVIAATLFHPPVR